MTDLAPWGVPRSSVTIALFPGPLLLATYRSSAGLRVGHSLIEEAAQMAVVDRVAILAEIDIDDPAQTLSHQGAPPFQEGLMDRTIRAGSHRSSLRSTAHKPIPAAS